MAAIGIMFILLLGGIDMSVGALYGLTSVVLVSTIAGTGSVIAGVLAALATALAVGLFNGFVVEKVRVPAFITTLGMSYIALAIAQMRSSGAALRVPADSAFQSMTTATVLGVPLLIVSPPGSPSPSGTCSRTRPSAGRSSRWDTTARLPGSAACGSVP